MNFTKSKARHRIFIYIFTALDGYAIVIAVSCKYDGAQMHDKWQNSDPKCLFVLARFFSPTTLKWSPGSLFIYGPTRRGVSVRPGGQP